jgi:hypothetical protein
MARFGDWKPLAGNWASQARMTQVDILSVHTMVGSLAGTDSMWRRTGYAGNHSHFGIGGNGECTQWQDTAYRAAANYNGNWHIISVECADVGAPFPAWNTADGSAVPAFSPAQLETLAQLIAAMCRAHNIPCQIIPDSKVGRRGIGWHRLGVPGYMLPGTEQWSTAQGKVCPGNRRIAQIPGVVARAQQILNGTAEDDMPYTPDEIKAMVRDAIQNDVKITTRKGESLTVPQTLERIEANTLDLTDAELNKIRNWVWASPLDGAGNIKDGQPWASTRLAGIDAKTAAGGTAAASGPVQVSAADRAAIVADVVAAIKALHLA